MRGNAEIRPVAGAMSPPFLSQMVFPRTRNFIRLPSWDIMAPAYIHEIKASCERDRVLPLRVVHDTASG